ncbi:MAG: hypothetical protein QOD51_2640 [Candidatus Eremiobacteraeota bacterium]|jgi:hypothetical protein|nr:hypothetical protein [Candidatus Eremiobacteraeota bacterium]
MTSTLECPVDAVDDIDLRVGSTTDLASEVNATFVTTFTNTLTESCTCATCSQGNCTSLFNCG